MADVECKSVGDAYREMWDELIPLQALGELMGSKQGLTAVQAEMLVILAERSVRCSVAAVERFEAALKTAGVEVSDAKPAIRAAIELAEEASL